LVKIFEDELILLLEGQKYI